MKSLEPTVPGQSHVTVDAFIDLRSPYAYLALQPARALAQRRGIRFEWWPFITDLRSAYGGEVEARSDRDIVKLKYLYMDCRRLAKEQGLTIRGTIKLWDASLASQAMLFAKSRSRLWEFCDPLLAAFWRREFDLESPAALASALASAGLRVNDWHDYQQASGPGDLGGDRLAMLEACMDSNQLVVRPEVPMSTYRGMLKPSMHLFKPEDFEIPKEPDREF